MTPKPIDLKKMKIVVENFSIFKCKLRHEKIAYDSNTGKPVYKEIGKKEKFKRIEFCSASTRKNRLGCAHSAANARFTNILKSLELYDPVFLFLRKKFDRATNGIYALDHQKGNLEKQMAKNPTEETKQKIDHIKFEHSELIKKIASIHRKTFQKIDYLLSESPGEIGVN